MLTNNQRITINGRVLPYVQSVEIVSSRNNFTDTCEIKINNRIPGSNQKISDLIELGSEVVVQLGYEPELVEEFRGYVSQVIPELTCVIRCEDEAYLYKRESVGEDTVVKKTNIVNMMTEVLENLGAVSAPIPVAGADSDVQMIQGTIAGRTLNIFIHNSNIGDWKISKTSTIIDVIAELQDKFRLYCYFRGRDLIIDANADQTPKRVVRAHFQRNVPVGQSSFNFKQSQADRIVVKATNITRAGVVQEVYAFYEGTPQRIRFTRVKPTSGSINEFNIGGQTDFSISDLQHLARRRLEALSFTGCDGSITIYGQPSARHGDICQVIDDVVPEKNANYAIVEVRKRFGVGIGYRQELLLGITLG